MYLYSVIKEMIEIIRIDQISEKESDFECEFPMAKLQH